MTEMTRRTALQVIVSAVIPGWHEDAISWPLCHNGMRLSLKAEAHPQGGDSPNRGSASLCRQSLPLSKCSAVVVCTWSSA